MEQLANLLDEQGHCVVDNFTVGRYNYGNIFFPDSFDVSGLNLDDIGKRVEFIIEQLLKFMTHSDQLALLDFFKIWVYVISLRYVESWYG